MAAAAANKHGPRAIIVEAEMGELLVAFGTNKVCVAPELGLRALEGAAEMVEVLLFSQVRGAAVGAFFANMQAVRVCTSDRYGIAQRISVSTDPAHKER